MNARISARPPISWLAIEPSNDPIAAGTANVNANRQQTRPWRASDPAPIAAARLTTTRLAVDAGPTGSPST